jgi:hypothetical protein
VSRFLALTATVALLLVVSAGVAAAGGWAMASLDTTPTAFEAGQTHQVGYRILQHGVRPVDVDKTEIRVFDDAGEMVAFRGKSTGEVGHYVAEVTVADPGTYRWEVTMGYFPAQELGTMEVSGALAAAGAGSARDWMRVVFPTAAVVSAGAVVLQALALRHRPALDVG